MFQRMEEANLTPQQQANTVKSISISKIYKRQRLRVALSRYTRDMTVHTVRGFQKLCNSRNWFRRSERGREAQEGREYGRDVQFEVHCAMGSGAQVASFSWFSWYVIYWKLPSIHKSFRKSWKRNTWIFRPVLSIKQSYRTVQKFTTYGASGLQSENIIRLIRVQLTDSDTKLRVTCSYSKAESQRNTCVNSNTRMAVGSAVDQISKRYVVARNTAAVRTTRKRAWWQDVSVDKKKDVRNFTQRTRQKFVLSDPERQSIDLLLGVGGRILW